MTRARRLRSAACGALVALAAACTSRATPHGGSDESDAAALAPAITGRAQAAIRATAPTTSSLARPASQPAPTAAEGDPNEAFLARATLVRLVAQRGPRVRAGRPGVFDALVEGPEQRSVVAQPSLVVTPLAHRAPLAFYRLARALGIDIVPPTALRAVSIDELAAALERHPGDAAPAGLREGALHDVRVQNDGTVDVLLAARSSAATGSPWEAPRGLSLDPTGGPQVAMWDRWASASTPDPSEDSRLLAGYLEMLVLDYLSANVSRRVALVTSAHAMVLADNASAFPAHVDRPLLDRLLLRLRNAARFPRGLRDALVRFDHAAATRLFNAGAFPSWLLAPRTILELEERRAALLTLIEARVAERGAEAVLSLSPLAAAPPAGDPRAP